MDPFDYGTLYQTLTRTAAKWGERTAYGVPPMQGRPYHPDGKELTWNETLAGVEAMKARYARAGYGIGHRVVILFHQRPEFLFHHFALNALGVSVVPLNPDYKVEEIAYVVEHAEACLAVSIDSRIPDMKQVAAQIGRDLPIVSLEDFPDTLPEPPTRARAATPDGATEGALLYTSGTTGRPKGCILTNEYFHTYGQWYVDRGGVIAMREGEERMYNPLPLHHANCLSISLPAMLLTGGALFFPDRFHGTTWWEDLVNCRITCFHYQGVIPNILMKLPEGQLERQHTVKFGFGAGLEHSLHEPFEQRFGLPLVEFWAMSETGRLITDNFEPRLITTKAIGRPAPGLEARLVDDQDRDVPDGEQGELIIRHTAAQPRKGFFAGYLKDDKATEEAWRNGWFHTGDSATRDSGGMLYFVDRRKNIIRRSGENIAAAEIDDCLMTHPKVHQAAALAVPDDLREEEVMACIVAKQPHDRGPELAREIFDWCAERLAYFKAPGWLLFVDSLPVTTSQRVHKIQIFPRGADPRQAPGIIDLRKAKKAPGKSLHQKA